MAKKGEKISEEHKQKITEAAAERRAKGKRVVPEETKVKMRAAAAKRWEKEKKIRDRVRDKALRDAEKKVAKERLKKPKIETKEVEVEKPTPVITNPAGRPLSPKLTDIQIEKLPTKFQTAEQLRGYILAQTDGGRQVVDTILADFRSRKSPKALKRDLAKMILELIIPDKGQKLDFAMESPDGKFVFRWQNEVVEDA